jgi:RNA-directed DNA polymerase
MTKASIDLQDLRRRIYVKAKAEPSWRFWGLYVHVCKMETLRAAYAMAKKNDGAPGIDGVTFEAIETQGVEALLEQLRDELSLSSRRISNRDRLDIVPSGLLMMRSSELLRR